ncbi:MAG: hypothetical protein LT102_16245 [Burkholderiaceae bacterium]|nr:hypothetical protein [Burkholderiaceae bacterium]
MNGFWITGIAINLIALVVVVAWAVRAWKQADAARGNPEQRDAGPES